MLDNMSHASLTLRKSHCWQYCLTIVKNRAQFNTVFPEQEEMDRVGFEPTTSAMLLRYSSKHDTLYFLLYNYF
jgi:hypothetical protein